MHRYYRCGLGMSEYASGYCPLDLYSGDETRVRKAVDCLLRSWKQSNGEANTFRMFAHGRRVNPDNVSLRLNSSIRQSELLNSICFSQIPAITSAYDLLSTFTDSSADSLITEVLVSALLKSPILSTLSHLQSSLDPLDIEGLEQAISSELGVEISNPDLDASSLGSQPTLEEWKEFLAIYQTSSTSIEKLPLRQQILAFLLSATFKDCSIIVRITKNSETGEMETKVKAIDLDPKPIKKLPHWFELDKRIVETWSEMLDELGEEQYEVRKCSG
jgi:inositol-pentakisphosphate 2-kinase